MNSFSPNPTIYTQVYIIYITVRIGFFVIFVEQVYTSAMFVATFKDSAEKDKLELSEYLKNQKGKGKSTNPLIRTRQH